MKFVDKKTGVISIKRSENTSIPTQTVLESYAKKENEKTKNLNDQNKIKKKIFKREQENHDSRI